MRITQSTLAPGAKGAVTSLVLIFVAGIFASNTGLSAPLRRKTQKPAVVAPTDWGQAASAELESARNETAKPAAKSKKAAQITNKATATDTTKAADESQPQTLTDAQESGVLPTPATVRTNVAPVESKIERTALRFTFLFEPYQPHGTGQFATGEKIQYSNLSPSVLGQVDLRWLPYEVGDIAGKPASIGGYGAFGYSRQNMPLVAPSGFRYDDVALNTLRYEVGGAIGLTLNSKFTLEGRVGVGRISAIQTSRYSDMVGTFERPYLVGALDLSYHLFPRFALVGSVARRTPLADGSGSIAFDPLTVSGGFLVQVR